MNQIFNQLKSQFEGNLSVLSTDNPSMVQIVVPAFHEDGDLVEIYFDISDIERGIIKITDSGISLMRLSYTYDYSSNNKQKILNTIIKEEDAAIINDEIFINSTLDKLYQNVLKFIRISGKISNMRLYSRTAVVGMFFDLLEESINENFQRFTVEKNYIPYRDGIEYIADYRITAQNKDKQFFVFGVNSEKTALYSTTSIQQFKLQNIPFFGITVLEDSDILPKKANKMLMTNSDKMYPGLDDFSTEAPNWILRQLDMVSRS